MKKNKFILLAVFFALKVSAQLFPKEIPYISKQAGSVTMPDYLGSMVNASFPDDLIIKRITKYNTQNVEFPYPLPIYAKSQPWNADASYYILYDGKDPVGGEGDLDYINNASIYNAKTHEFSHRIPDDVKSPVWSNTNKDLIYSFGINGKIRTYKVSTREVKVVYSFPEYDTINNRLFLGPGEGNIDKNDHYVALVGNRGGKDMEVIIFDLKANQEVSRKTFVGASGDSIHIPKYLDWVSISQSGNYVGINWNGNTATPNGDFGHYGVEIYKTGDINNNGEDKYRRIVVTPSHGDFGYDINGEEVYVQTWGPIGRPSMFYLGREENVVLSDSNDFFAHGHISCRNLNRPGYAYHSYHDKNGNSGQILAFKLDPSGSGLVEHFGFHYSSSASYLRAAMAVPTPNGDKVMFKSDFGNAGSDELYVFEVSIPCPKGSVMLTSPINDITSSETNYIGHATISASNKIGATGKSEYRAGEGITLTPGFEVVSGGDYRGHISECIGYNTPTNFLDTSEDIIKNVLRVFPNPAEHSLTLEVGQDRLNSLQLYNTQGQVMYSNTNIDAKNFNLNVEGFSRGFYILKVVLSNQSIMYKNVVLK